MGRRICCSGNKRVRVVNRCSVPTRFLAHPETFRWPRDRLVGIVATTAKTVTQATCFGSRRAFVCCWSNLPTLFCLSGKHSYMPVMIGRPTPFGSGGAPDRCQRGGL
jgi:hypothetical protein